jgi:transcription antitermination factor NusG
MVCLRTRQLQNAAFLAVALSCFTFTGSERNVFMHDHGNGGWFALIVKWRFEKHASNLLREKGFETFLPLERCRRQGKSKPANVQVPLFPGYVFARFDPFKRLPVLITPGVISVVKTSVGPVSVPETEIDAIKRATDSDCVVRRFPYGYVGEKVRIEEGPLKGIEGIVLSTRKQSTLILSITLLQRSISVEIDSRSTAAVREMPRLNRL